MGVTPVDVEAWLSHLPHGVAAIEPVRDADGQIVDFRYDFVNEKLAAILGHDRALMEGRLLTEVHRQPTVGEAIRRLAAADGAATVVDSLRSRGGTLTVSAVQVGRHVVVAAREPTEETRRNRALQELLDSLERSADFVGILDPVVAPDTGELEDFRIRSMNDAGLRRLRLERDTAIGGRLRDVLPGMSARIRDGFRTAFVTGLPFVADDLVGGRHYSGSMRIVAMPFEEGLIVTSRDTSEEVRTREALARSEAQYLATLQALYEAVIVVTPVRDDECVLVDLRVEYLNEVARAMARLPYERLVGSTLLQLFPGERPDVLVFCDQVLTTGDPVVLDLEWQDRTLAVRIARSNDGLVAAVQDVTHQRRAAAQLADSERRYRLLADHVADVVLLSRHGGTDWVAPSVEQLVGYTPEEFKAIPLMDWVYHEDAPVVVSAALALAQTGAAHGRMRAKHRDGSLVWVEIALRSIPNFDDDGEAVDATVWNIQAQVEAEQELALAEQARRAQEERLQQASRLESLGVMAGGIAHDFNNLLVGVLGNTEMALHALERAQTAGPVESVGTAVDRLGNVIIAAQRAAELTRQLLDYAGRRPRDREPVELHALVEELPGLVAPRLGPHADLTIDVGPEPVRVLGDRGQLQQVLMNLVINAADALGDRPGQVSVRLWTRPADPSVDAVGGVRDDAAMVAVLEVADNGIGIDPDALSRIFEPFFTTRSNGRGLGLAVAHGIVRSHRGRIAVTSQTGVGTTMTVTLPSTEEGVLPVPPVVDARPVFATTPLVLVIDDDHSVADVSATVLRSGGLEAEIETDPLRAIEQFRARPERYSAVLLDLTMPTMHGDRVIAELRAIDPAVPVVVVSGYAESALDGRLDSHRINAFVHKPYRAGDLLTAVVSAVRPTPADR